MPPRRQNCAAAGPARQMPTRCATCSTPQEPCAGSEAGLARQLSAEGRRAARAGASSRCIVPLLVGVLVALHATATTSSAAAATRSGSSPSIALVILGWAFARDIGRAIGPALFRRMDPATAGTVGFLIRLLTIGVALIVALRIAGLEPRTLAVGGAFTAVVFGLAAQQTLGNLIAGTVLLSARPVPGRRPRPPPGRRRGRPGRGRGQLARAALHDAGQRRGLDHGAQQRRALRRRSCRCASPTSVDLRARLRRGRDAQRRPGAARGARHRADPQSSRRSCSRRSTATRSSCASRPRRSGPSDGPKLADEILLGGRREVASSDGRDQSRAGAARRARRLADRAERGAGSALGAVRRARTPGRAAASFAPESARLMTRPACRWAAAPAAAAPRRSSPQRRRPRSPRGRARSPARPRAPTSPGRARAGAGGSCDPGVREHARRRAMKPGKTTETPTPVVAQVLAQPQREPAQPELRRRVER